MRTLKLTLAYDGTDFAGWQFQPKQRTLQDTLEQTLEKITGQFSRVFASGRTDAGVHALGQVVSFETESTLSAEILQRALNAELPHDMAAVKVEEASFGFNARREAKRKRYRYQICDDRVRDVFRRRYAWQLFNRLDVPAMQRAAEALVGEHDFASFETAGSQRETTERTVYQLTAERLQESNHMVQIEIEADGRLPQHPVPDEHVELADADAPALGPRRNVLGEEVSCLLHIAEPELSGVALTAQSIPSVTAQSAPCQEEVPINNASLLQIEAHLYRHGA
jgi:tRNA pseudouridine38-40 synthase